MATSQIHHEFRSDFPNRIAAFLKDRDAAAAANQRYTDIGVPPATGDGGVAATGQLAVAIAALAEVLSSAVGDGDFDGIAPVIAPLTSSTVGSPINIGTGVSGVNLTVRIANLLPFPSIALRPVGGGGDIDVLPFIKSTEWSKSTSPFAGAVGVVSVGTVTIGDVSTALSGGYRLVVQNPLDTTTVAVVSTDSVFLTAP